MLQKVYFLVHTVFYVPFYVPLGDFRIAYDFLAHIFAHENPKTSLSLLRTLSLLLIY